MGRPLFTRRFIDFDMLIKITNSWILQCSALFENDIQDISLCLHGHVNMYPSNYIRTQSNYTYVVCKAFLENSCFFYHQMYGARASWCQVR